MPLLTTRAGASSRAYGFGGAAGEELGGMVLLTPSSISSTGTGNSSSIGANGSVTFSSCDSISLNGVFGSAYDNYVVICREKAVSSAGYGLSFRLRASGTDNSTASSYTYQRIYANNTSLTGVRSSDDKAFLYDTSGSSGGFAAYFYGPYLAQPTAIRTNPSVGYQNTINEPACTHNQSVAYDGFTLIVPTTTISGLISVYGLKGA